MRTERSTGSSSRTIVDAKMSLSLWLRAGRAQKGLSLEDVAKITKIQPRILERLEAGKLEGLPAEVFVRGFVRSFARCVGLDEAEALERYSLAASAPSASARALVESMSELAPTTARSPKVLRREPEVIEVADIIVAPPPAPPEPVVEMMLPETGTLLEPPPVVAEPVVVVEPVASDVMEAAAAAAAAPVESTPAVIEAVIAAEVAAVDGVQLAIDAVATVEPAKKGGKRKRGGKKTKRGASATEAPVARASASGTPAQPTPVVVEAEALAKHGALEDAAREVAQAALATMNANVDVVTTPAADIDMAAPTTAIADGSVATATAVVADELVDATTASTAEVADETTTMSEPWSPKMPTVVAPTVPWRRAAGFGGAMTSTAAAPVVPSLVIDDADPDSAERELEDRQSAKEPARRSFLPPILLDREDRSARQGGLTLAVIILLIAATLTLSYLMRRPSSTGDGVTMNAAAQTHQTIA